MTNEQVDIGKWAGVVMAALAAFGGYMGSVTSKAHEDGELRARLHALEVEMKDHAEDSRTNDRSLQQRLADIEARLRVQEAKK